MPRVPVLTQAAARLPAGLAHVELGSIAVENDVDHIRERRPFVRSTLISVAVAHTHNPTKDAVVQLALVELLAFRRDRVPVDGDLVPRVTALLGRRETNAERRVKLGSTGGDELALTEKLKIARTNDRPRVLAMRGTRPLGWMLRALTRCSILRGDNGACALRSLRTRAHRRSTGVVRGLCVTLLILEVKAVGVDDSNSWWGNRNILS